MNHNRISALWNRTRQKPLLRALAPLLLAMMVSVGGAMPQLPVPTSSQFDITGFLQEATLDLSCATSAHCGGTLKVNGQVVTVPKETIVILPANALTWQELFAQAPAPFGLTTGTTGLALGDALRAPAPPLTSYDVHLVGNRVTVAAGGDQYIAGLIYISQQALNSGAGFINSINYAIGEMLVGPTNTRVQINDSAGRYGRIVTPDGRFTADPSNPTITAATGFPMCLPRVDPATTPDALCPQPNRPRDLYGNPATILQMNAPAVPPLTQAPPDPSQQAPFQVGDFITFSGTLVHDGLNPTAGPWPAVGTAATYISAHTITANVAIYTYPGTDPAYLKIDIGLMGTGGLLIIGATEPALRTRFEGMTTDPTRIIHLFGMDLNPSNGAVTERDWGAVGVDPGQPTGVQKGRWRFRPPCTAGFPAVGPKACSQSAAGTYLPPPREVRARIQNPTTFAFSNATQQTAANGLITGQFHAPILTYIFSETIIGQPIIPNAFEGFDFLAKGGYRSSVGTLAAQLNPWPGAGTPPPPTCTPAGAIPGGPYAVAATGTVIVAGNATGTAPISFQWAPPLTGTLSSLNAANPVYTAPSSVPANPVVDLPLTATNACGTSTNFATVTIVIPGTPSVNTVPPVTVLSGAPGSFPVSAFSSGLSVNFKVTQTGTPALLNLAVTSTGPTTATVTFTAPILPFGQVTPVVINLTITATNTANITSAPVSTTATVDPLPDSIRITSAEFRTTNRRLSVLASSSVVSPAIVFTLQPYATTLGTVFDPATMCAGCATFTYTGAGNYSIDIVGVPEPAVPPNAPLRVTSNLRGASLFTALTRIRN